MKYIANPVEVEAYIIVSVGPIESNGSMKVALQNGENAIADKSMIARYIPSEGDYWVRQSDGYVYLNPKEVFERKYSVPVPTAVAGNAWADIAASAYRAYAASTGNKNFRGEPMPEFGELPVAIQTAWEVAVRHASNVGSGPITSESEQLWDGWVRPQDK